SGPYGVQPIKDLSEDPKPKASIVVGNVMRHEGFKGIEDGHGGSRRGTSLRCQYNAYDRALILSVRQRDAPRITPSHNRTWTSDQL
ncbi:MAG TPA: hypothetical protein VER98_15720, partial [Terriglobia bacterium]|nr:hypothetical protein [Terriglobia bacterium]